MFFTKFRSKLLAYTLGIIALSGLLIIIFINILVSDKLGAELQRIGVYLAKDIANESIHFLLTEKVLDLQLNVNEHYSNLTEEFRYIFITDQENNVLAHTFGDGFPTDLTGTNNVRPGEEYHIQPLNSEEGRILDIAVPVLNGDLGVVHLGLQQAFISESVSNITYIIMYIIIGVLVLGGGIMIALARSITVPISKLTDGVKKISDGDLTYRVDVRSKDEIGNLAEAFNKMTEKLMTTTVRRDELTKEVSERIKAEETLRFHSEILSNIEEGVNLVRLNDSIIAYTNPKFDMMFGYGPDELIGKHVSEIYAPSVKSHEETTSDIIKSVRKEGIWRGQVHNIRKDGTIFWSFANISILDHKEYEKVLVTVQSDITERINLEEQLRQAQKMETVGQLAGGVAHDFNNILGAMMNYGHLLQNKLENKEQKEIVMHILDLTDRASKLTSDLLAFSRKQILETTPVKLNEIIKRVEKLMTRIIGEHIEIKTILTEKDPLVVADSGQIEQVLMNLLTNAQDAMPDGGVLTIETEDTEIDNQYIRTHGYGEPGKYVILSISDTGTGMDKETREKIFDPFYTTKEAGKGTGLGLAMVYGIIKQHNGYINVYSEPGKGTTFRIYLPLTGEDAEEVKPSVSETITKGTETVLLAEDDKELRIVTRQLLEASGYKVIEAVDGEDALEKFKDNSGIEFLVLDMVMPKKSGKKAYDEIRKESPDIKALFMTGYTEDTIFRKEVLEDRLNLISKPFAPREFLNKIREVLSNESEP